MRRSFPPLPAVAAVVALAIVALAACARHPDDAVAPNAAVTEVYAPIPPVVTPAPGAGLLTPPPSDAVVLFDGRDLAQWTNVASGG
ncbi:MAG TPA: hypothetical protein VGD56_05425, partial [Gemmatirosa sp.]